MNLKNLFDEAVTRGERFKDEVINDIVNSKTLHKIVTNKNFITAISRVIETKDEVKKSLHKQMNNIMKMMDLPRRNELSKIGEKITQIEESVEKWAAKRIPIKTLPKAKKKKASPAKKAPTKKSSGSKKKKKKGR